MFTFLENCCTYKVARVPDADYNFIVIPIFNPPAYCTPFCSPSGINRFILFCGKLTHYYAETSHRLTFELNFM